MHPGRGRNIECNLEKIRDEFFGKDSKEGADLAMLESKTQIMKGFLVDVEKRAAEVGQNIEAKKTAHLVAKHEREVVVRELGEEDGSLEGMRRRMNAVWDKARFIKKGDRCAGFARVSLPSKLSWFAWCPQLPPGFAGQGQGPILRRGPLNGECT